MDGPSGWVLGVRPDQREATLLVHFQRLGHHWQGVGDQFAAAR